MKDDNLIKIDMDRYIGDGGSSISSNDSNNCINVIITDSDEI